ncbi:MAG TPA: twin-arginine translocase subunit TatC [Devosia sp.]|nr:twin-arginine translocase subunit TatC [Devosia sp.]
MADTAQLPPPEAKEDDELKGSEAPLLDHLIELRKRLIYSLIAVVVFFLACFAFAKQIYDLLLLPFRWAGGSNMIFTAPQELFFTYMNVALFGAIFLAFPIIAGQIYAFVAPGLYKRERRAFVPYLIATPVFFLLGSMLVYFVVAPMALHFFLGMQQTNPGDVQIEMQTRVSEYLGFVMTLIIAFGICFQLPVILTLLARIELVNTKQLAKGRKYAIVGILAVAALLTPPDPISQIGLSLPMYALYEISILSVRWVEKQRAAKEAAEAAKA